MAPIGMSPEKASDRSGTQTKEGEAVVRALKHPDTQARCDRYPF